MDLLTGLVLLCKVDLKSVLEVSGSYITYCLKADGTSGATVCSLRKERTLQHVLHINGHMTLKVWLIENPNVNAFSCKISTTLGGRK